MANYLLISIRTDEETLKFLEEVQNFGTELSIIASEFMMKGNKRLPLLKGLSEEFDRAVPEPEAITIAGQTIGAIHGIYYDGNAVGVDVKSPLAPPRSIIFTTIDFQVDDISNVHVKDMLDVLRNFKADPNRHEWDEPLNPAFYNDTDRAIPFCIVKRTPFRLEDEDQIVRDASGHAWNMKQRYVPPRIIS